MPPRLPLEPPRKASASLVVAGDALSVEDFRTDSFFVVPTGSKIQDGEAVERLADAPAVVAVAGDPDLPAFLSTRRLAVSGDAESKSTCTSSRPTCGEEEEEEEEGASALDGGRGSLIALFLALPFTVFPFPLDSLEEMELQAVTESPRDSLEEFAAVLDRDSSTASTTSAAVTGVRLKAPTPLPSRWMQCELAATTRRASEFRSDIRSQICGGGEGEANISSSEELES